MDTHARGSGQEEFLDRRVSDLPVHELPRSLTNIDQATDA